MSELATASIASHIRDTPESEILVEVSGISKKFCRTLRRSLFYAVKDMGRELTGRSIVPELRNDEFWSLNDISFTLKRGEAIGIIGPNGAGKSTLLKIITGIIKPTEGYVRTRGRVQALIELSAGMNPILSGRDNIYTRAMLLGLSKVEIDEKFDEIVEFAELGEFIDMPVQNYSSGMQVKLGFSIAINVNPDILILDEVLAVGDQKFRAKAREAMQILLDRNVALIFISHNMNQVMNITDKVLWIERGVEQEIGPPRDTCANYLANQQSSNHTSAPGGAVIAHNRSLGYLNLDSIEIEGAALDQYGIACVSGDEEQRKLCVVMNFTVNRPLPGTKARHHQFISTRDGTAVAYNVMKDMIDEASGNSFQRNIELDLSSLNPGHYIFGFNIQTGEGMGSIYYGTLQALEIQIMPKIDEPSDWLSGDRCWTYMSHNTTGAVELPVTLLNSPIQTHS